MVCPEYWQDGVDAAICEGIRLLGGIESIFGKEERILLKPNLLAKAEPDRAVTTHPTVFKAVGAYLREQGYEHLSYGDSPGNPLGGVARVAAGCGLKEPAEELEIPLGDFSQGQKVNFEQGQTEKEFIISKGILDCDGIVNICKMKTHQLERITGAAKNMFGAVYGVNKGAFHAKYTDADSFGAMIADLNNLVKARLHIMDGILAMEGNGPQSGTPVAMGLLLFSKDPIALDTVFCHLIGLNPELVPTNRYGQQYGVGTMDAEKIRVRTIQGDMTVEKVAKRYGKEDYDVYRGTEKATQIRLLKPIQSLLQKKPYILREKCIKCGICAESCPLEKKALEMSGYPKYAYKACIRCYCCQEMCPQKAIDVKVPLLARIMDRNWKI
ncbi:DUF362 domain-containing protein [Aminipila butyrica]|uniref:DUF362 domain-containing protein n=2 Tax=Aminipila butyrica TaxID=433296 RepID=A0A858BZQ4_9FIRM|nr:DUF362 domain-containing protein [Aminipila butyrica]